MNIIQIAGHLAADPETRFTQSGQKVTSFRVGTNVRRAGKEETIWFRVTIWGDRFDKMLTYLKKGSSIIVGGELAPPQLWTDKEGRTQVGLEITAEFLRFSPFGKPAERQGQEQGQQYTQGYAPAAPQAAAAPHGGFGEQSFGSTAQGGNAFAGTGAGARGQGGQGGHEGHGGGGSQEQEDELPF